MDRLSTKGSMIDQIDLSRVPRSGFDRSFHNFMSGKLGTIIPTRIEEVLPGDRIKGSTHIVANFEPLVAPILGSMVLKQESFYVPQSQLWKSAHNFFTGKKGFENPILSQSHRDMFKSVDSYTIRASGSTRTVPILGFTNFIKSINDTHVDLTDYDHIETEWRGTLIPIIRHYIEDELLAPSGHLHSWATTYKVLDLLLPLDYHLKTWKTGGGFSLQPAWVGDPSYTIAQQIKYVRDFMVPIFEFWFGPSSMLDYMGLCIPNCSNILYNIFSNLSGDLSDEDVINLIYEQFSDIPLNWLPFRAAYSCWYWNYRDQLLESDALDAEEFCETDLLLLCEVPLLLLMRYRCWFKDTFTTALTNTGNGNILVPASSDAIGVNGFSMSSDMVTQDTSHTSDSSSADSSGGNVTKFTIGGISYSVPSNYLVKNPNLQDSFTEETHYYVSLDLIDRAKRLSTWLSKRLILGVEYDDVLYSSFMVKLSNVRMRVPELLDASRSTVAMNTIINNTTIPDAQVAGDKTAVAWAENKSDGINYYAEEHGYLLSFMTIMPIQSYAGGINRMYLRQNRFDFAWPEFSQMGMDAIYCAELATPFAWRQADDAALAVFGYQGRYYDYKSKLDEEHGRMLTDLNYMTFARDFKLDYAGTDAPRLNYAFVHCHPSLDMFVTDDPNVDIIRTIDVSHNYHWERVLPVPSETIR